MFVGWVQGCGWVWPSSTLQKPVSQGREESNSSVGRTLALGLSHVQVSKMTTLWSS